MADVIRKMAEGHTVADIDGVIDEVAAARGEYDSLEARLDDLPSGEDEDRDRAALTELIDNGPKNAISFSEIGKSDSHGTTYSSSGVDYTLNSDFTITATRTSTSTVDSSCTLRIDTGSLYIDNFCNGDYILSGCPAGGGNTTYSLRAIRDEYRPTDTGNGVELPDKGTNTNIYINILISKDFTGTVTFKPMICSKAAWNISHIYQPFRPSYQELYDRVLALESGTVLQRNIASISLDSSDAEENER